MVVASLSLGGLVGIVLSGGFVYWEVGRYATPQVPVTLFDERRELFAYTAGLFVGVPIAVVYLLFVTALSNGALPGALLFLGLLVGGSEIAQILLLRSRYWGMGEARPFYALGFRAAIGGILALAVMAAYLSGPTVSPVGLTVAALDSGAVVALQVAASLLSMRAPATTGRPAGGPLSGVLLGAAGYFLIGLGPGAGPIAAAGAAVVALMGATLAYGRRRSILAEVRPQAVPSLDEGRTGAVAYGRTTTALPEPLPDARSPRGPPRSP